MGWDGANGTISKEMKKKKTSFFISFFKVPKKRGFYLASIVSLGILAVIAPP